MADAPPPDMTSGGDRFSPYTDTNHQAPLWIVTALTLTYSMLFMFTRIAVKYKVLGLDDLFLGVANVLGITQWAVMFSALKKGVGKSADDAGNATTVLHGDPASLIFASRILFLLALGISKLSIVLFLRDVFAPSTTTAKLKKKWGACIIYFIVAAVWTVVSVLLTSAGCSPSDILKLEGEAHCSGDITRWIVMAVIDVVLELVLVFMPIYLFVSLQITRSRKLTIFVAFFPRIIVPGFLIAFVNAYINFRHHGGTSLTSISMLVWQQVVLGCALVTATTPCLKGFLGKFRTDGVLGATDASYSAGRYSRGSRGGNGRLDSYNLSSISRKSSFRRIPEPPLTLPLKPPEIDLSGKGVQGHTATAYAEPAGGSMNTSEGPDESVKSYGSERMMIHRKVEYNVHTS